MKKSHTIPVKPTSVPPKAIFSAVTCVVGPMMNVVPVSAIAYADELTVIDPTATLFKSNNKHQMKN